MKILAALFIILALPIKSFSAELPLKFVCDDKSKVYQLVIAKVRTANFRVPVYAVGLYKDSIRQFALATGLIDEGAEEVTFHDAFPTNTTIIEVKLNTRTKVATLHNFFDDKPKAFICNF